MEGLVPIFQAILGNDNGIALKGILLLIIGVFIWLYVKTLHAANIERKELTEMFQKQIESDRKELIEVIERYQEGQINVIQAMNEIRILIASIGARL